MLRSMAETTGNKKPALGRLGARIPRVSIASRFALANWVSARLSVAQRHPRDWVLVGGTGFEPVTPAV